MVKTKNSQIALLVFLLIVFGAIAVFLFLKLQESEDENVPTSTEEIGEIIERNATLELRASTEEYKVGEEYSIAVWVDAEKYKLIGTDVRIKFDPSKISIKEIATVNGDFDLYPLNKVSEDLILLSGLSEIDSYKEGTLLLGTIIIVPVADGNANIDFVFELGSTVDSNVVELESAIDRLGAVSNLSISITN